MTDIYYIKYIVLYVLFKAVPGIKADDNLTFMRDYL